MSASGAATPKITICVPVYNGLPHLEKTVSSLLGQTLRDFELLIIDDGSRDGSGEFLESLTDERIRLIRQSNRGVSATLNRCIAEARGAIIARSDQDDVSLPERLERQYACLHDHRLDCVLSHIRKIGLHRTWSNLDKEVTRPNQIRMYDPLGDGCVADTTMMVKKDAILDVGGFRADFFPADDWDLELRLSEKYRVGILQEPLVFYRLHPDSLTHQVFFLMQDKARWTRDCYERRRQGLPELPFDNYVKRQNKSLLHAFNWKRKDIHTLLVRNAGEAFLWGRYLHSAAYLAAAGLARPVPLMARALALFRNATRAAAGTRTR